MLKISKINLIKDSQVFLHELYGEVNKEREWDYLIGFLNRTSSYLCKKVVEKKQTAAHFVKPLSWLFEIASKFNIDVDESFFKKYPLICPYCMTKPCLCFKTNKQPYKDIPAYEIEENMISKYLRLDEENFTKDFESACKNIFELYPNNEVIWHYAGPWYQFVKLFEEIGELHEAISRYEKGIYEKGAIEGEIADVFAWLLSLWITVYPEKNLQSVLIDYYYKGCPVCKNNPCCCKDRSNRIGELIDLENFREIGQYLVTLSDHIPIDHKEKIVKMVKSIDSVLKTQKEAVANAAITQTKHELSKLRETLPALDKKGDSLFNTLTKLMGQQ